MKLRCKNLLKRNVCTRNLNKPSNNTFVIRVLHAFTYKKVDLSISFHKVTIMSSEKSHMIMSLKFVMKAYYYSMYWTMSSVIWAQHHINWFSCMQLHISSQAEQFQIFTL